jgi:nucleotide-binding universal stress UspA family protein
MALARDAGFEPTSKLVRGKAWRAICGIAEELDAEPIVVGTRGLGRMESALLGSVSSAVVVHAKRSVLAVPPHGGDGLGPALSE